MKTLPPYSKDVFWKEYEIKTPTFSLTPVEKPDMSPFLIHMTGKKEIQMILSGNGAPQPGEDGKGFLCASVPSQTKGDYHAKVVCFTESPTFALDFFRYRKFDRWKKDLRFGIGFSKEKLTVAGVRPALYADNNLVARIISRYEAIKDDGTVNEADKWIASQLYPLCTPLLENEVQEGFLWEREWRYPNENGLIFDHRDVRVICCPEEEQRDIEEILGDVTPDVQFVRSWKEFSDVVNYIKRQQMIWSEGAQKYEKATTADEVISGLVEAIRQLSISLHSLGEYEENLSRAETELARVRQQQRELESKLNALQSRLDEQNSKLAEQAN